MARRIASKRALVAGILFIILSLTWASSALLWGDKTNDLINEAALLKLPEDFPSFLKEEKVWVIYSSERTGALL